MSLLEKIREIYNRGKHTLDALWEWAMKPDGVRGKLKRFRALQRWAKQKKDAQPKGSRDREQWRTRFRRYRRKARRLLKRWREKKEQEPGSGGFETWMLNGHPGNVAGSIKEVIAAAVDHGLYTTSTTDGSSHAATSFHYPWNNSDGLGHGVDLGGSWTAMVNFQRYVINTWPSAKELFGPQNDLCLKFGQRITISGALATAHDNHDHVAR